MKVASTIALGIPLLASATFPSNLTVVSQDGVPIPNVYIAGSKLSDFKATLHAWTDENGNAVVNGTEWEQATTVEAIKPGFYETVGSTPILDGPDHATIKLVAPIRPVSLKPIREKIEDPSKANHNYRSYNYSEKCGYYCAPNGWSEKVEDGE